MDFQEATPLWNAQVYHILAQYSQATEDQKDNNQLRVFFPFIYLFFKSRVKEQLALLSFLPFFFLSLNFWFCFLMFKKKKSWGDKSYVYI